MLDQVLNTPMQTDTLQSTRCNEAWNGIKDEVNEVDLMKNLLQCQNKIRNSKDKKVKEKKHTEVSPVFPTYAELMC